MLKLCLFFLFNLLSFSSELKADGFIIDFVNDISYKEIQTLAKELDLKPLEGFEADEKMYQFKGFKNGLNKIFQRLFKSKKVENIEPNYILELPEQAFIKFLPKTLEFPNPNPNDYNDPFYDKQWHMAQIYVKEAQKHSLGEGTIVAVIDTGVAYEDKGRFKKVRDLNQTIFVKPYNFLNNTEDAHDDHGHGTHVAGTIAQSTNNGLGVIGIAPKAKIMPLKVLAANGGGDVASIARAIRYAADNGANVINLSLGGPIPMNILKKALAYARSKGVLPICAAGNSGRSVGYPAAYEECMAVSAVQYDQKITFYSSRGSQIDIAAPGGNVKVDQNGDGYPDGVLQNTIYPNAVDKDDYMLFMGTSMAAPHVSGVATLIYSLGINNPQAVESILKKSATPKGKPELYGAGLLNAKKAMELVKHSQSKTTFLRIFEYMGLVK